MARLSCQQGTEGLMGQDVAMDQPKEPRVHKRSFGCYKCMWWNAG